MIIIKKIYWIDKDAQEADIELSDGTYSFKCFAHIFSYSERDVFTDMIYGLQVENVVKSFNEKYKFIEKDNAAYFITGKLINSKDKILQIGEFKIGISDGHIDKDIKQNEFIDVDINRIDIY